ncbi:MAG: Unknown protein [uncultured Sulfurovum sp.]|uniref:DUF4365 domain-containing protein n=1 Tax=uncultured Sulfurovum sp. TaxID=269237 RepID=A0A6S6SP71_9BACT|nr:MAG: Unknown protein [uncultured Sulfurovum sp.]
MNNFLKLETTKLGTAAEDMVGSEFIISKGYMPFNPAVSCSHPIDFIAMSGASKFNLDVKAKSRMVYLPYTGIDLKDYNEYKTYTEPTYLLFVDPSSSSVYGQWLSRLDKHPSKIYGGGNMEEVIVWPVSGMTHYRDLTTEETKTLKQYENSNYR